ncbi:extracellular serine-rich protein [Sarocladium implicatum]|nr:extracellular serine-rich protein [Sarocladium implicatum]
MKTNTMLALVLSILFPAVTVFGQRTSDGTSSPSGTAQERPSSTSPAIATHTIAVGASGHKFTPPETTAKIGDILEFRFYPVEHWVIRGDFDYPCVPYEYVGTDRRGFSSGEQSVQAITDDVRPRYRVRVNDTDPIWFYCGAPGSCVRFQMMGVVNAPSNASIEDWQQAGKDVDYQLRPGDPWPSEADFPTDTPSATSGPSQIPEDQGEDDKSSQGLSGGATAGIVIGSLAGILLIALAGFCCLRRRGFSIIRHKEGTESASRVNSVPPGSMMEPRLASGVFDGWSQQKSPYYHHHHSSQGVYHFSIPTTPPFSASEYGTYPPQSVSPQPTAGNETVSSAMSSSPRQNGTTSPYHDHMRAFLQAQPSNPHKPETASPVELPASHDPGNSPLPTYKEQRFSWAGAEEEYRPSKGTHVLQDGSDC